MAEDRQPANPFLTEADAPSESRAPKPVLSSVAPAPTKGPDVPVSSPVTPPLAKPSTVSSDQPNRPLTRAKDEDSTRIATERMLADPTSRGRWKKLGRIAIIALVGLLLIGGGYRFWTTKPVATEPLAPSTPTSQAPAPATTVEEVPPTLLDDTASYESENFKAGEIVFLGEAEFLQLDEGVDPLTLENIRGEAFTEKNKQEVKLVITWVTNKLATAEVGYAKGIGQTPKTITTEDFAYDHSLILTGLDPASTYLYTIKATDRFGNAVTSEPYAVFTGARSVSLFDLIAGAIGEVFGWAVK